MNRRRFLRSVAASVAGLAAAPAAAVAGDPSPVAGGTCRGKPRDSAALRSAEGRPVRIAFATSDAFEPSPKPWVAVDRERRTRTIRGTTTDTIVPYVPEDVVLSWAEAILKRDLRR